VVDDEEEASADSEITSENLDGPVELPAENVSENVPAVSLAPLGNECTIPLLDKLTLEMARDMGRTEAPSEPELFGTVSENKRPAGNQDLIEPGTCSTSGLSTRPGMDVPQVAAHLGVEDLVPGPQPEPVEFDFQAAGVPHSPAGLFGGRYPDRKRNTVQQPENNQTTAKSTFCGYVQVQKDTLIIEPESYIQAINSPESEQWENAMQDEMKSLKALGTWSYVVVDDKQKKKALPVKWVYKIKLSEIGEIERFKARLVAKGFRQIYGVDYTEVYAPVSKHSTLRYILSKAVHRNMHVHQMDVSTAFLHGDLTEKVFIQQPEGFHVGGPNTVCRCTRHYMGLNKPLEHGT
jgi:hypothetical protein